GDRRGFASADRERVVRQQPRQLLARARNPALDGADRAVADPGRLLVTEAAGANEHQDFAMIRAELPEGAAEVTEFERCLLRRGNCVLRDRRFIEWHAARMILAALVVVKVAQDGEDPGLEIGAWGELLGRRQRADCGVM